MPRPNAERMPVDVTVTVLPGRTRLVSMVSASVRPGSGSNCGNMLDLLMARLAALLGTMYWNATSLPV